MTHSVKTSLQKFDSDECKDKFKENKKAFSKASEKYYSSMTSGLSLGEKELIKKKGELKITQADDEAKNNREAFHACRNYGLILAYIQYSSIHCMEYSQ